MDGTPIIRFPKICNHIQFDMFYNQHNGLLTIYGPKISYRDALEKSGLKSLQGRRLDHLRAFSLKAYQNPRFSHTWFPDRPGFNYGMRRSRTISLEARGNDVPLSLQWDQSSTTKQHSRSAQRVDQSARHDNTITPTQVKEKICKEPTRCEVTEPINRKPEFN